MLFCETHKENELLCVVTLASLAHCASVYYSSNNAFRDIRKLCEVSVFLFTIPQTPSVPCNDIRKMCGVFAR